MEFVNVYLDWSRLMVAEIADTNKTHVSCRSATIWGLTCAPLKEHIELQDYMDLLGLKYSGANIGY
jgi:hypothetical protein